MPLSPPILNVVHSDQLEGDKLICCERKIHEKWKKKSTKVEELGGFVKWWLTCSKPSLSDECDKRKGQLSEEDFWKF